MTSFAHSSLATLTLVASSALLASCGATSPLSASETLSKDQTKGGVEFVSAVIRDLDYEPQSETKVCYAVFAGPDGFPNDTSKVVLNGCEPVDARIVSFLIDGLPPTEDGYAISFFQDMNGNGVLDTRNLFGFKVPDEPFGFTQNPNLRGQPRYEDVRIDPEKSGEKIEILMKKI